MLTLNDEPEWGQRTGWSIALKFALTVVFVVMIIVTVCVVCGHNFFTDTLQESYSTTAYNIAHTAADAVDADSLDGYLETQTADDAWQTTHDELQRLCDNMNCTFIYVIRLAQDQSAYEYVFEAVNADMGYDEYPLGYRDEVTDTGYLENYKAVLAGQEPSNDYLFSYPVGSNEANTTAYLPLVSSAGSQYMLVVEMPMSLIVEGRTHFLVVMSLVSYGDAIILLFIMLLVLQKRMIMPIRRINDEARRFVVEEAKPSDALSCITNRDELGMMARTITKMEYATRKYIDELQTMTAERERVGTELEVATHIQKSTLPMTFPLYPETKDYKLFAIMKPAKEVGGDFYDFFKVDDDHLALIIADVSGKGVPAALFMMASKIEMKNHAMLGIGAAETLRRVNNNLCSNNAMDMFVTAWIGIYEISTHTLTCSNAGHEFPALCRANGEFEIFKDEHKMALGAFPGVRYAEYEIQMGVGDTLLVYTDGVAEATNVNSELFGLDRMLESLNKHKDEEPEQIVNALVGDVMEFTGEAEQFDDVTALCFYVVQ